MRLSVLLALAALCPVVLPAQDKGSDAVHTYKVEFRLGEGTGPGGGHFTLLSDSGGASGSIRSGTRIPILNGKDETTWVDVGVNIDCRVREMSGKAILLATIDVSAPASSAAPPSLRPQISQTRVTINAALQPGKPTVVASSDDSAGQRRFAVEATLTRLD